MKIFGFVFIQENFKIYHMYIYMYVCMYFFDISIPIKLLIASIILS